MTDAAVPALAPDVQVLAPRRRLQALRKLARHRSFRIGLAIVVVLALAAALGPLLTGFDPTAMRVRLRFRPPSSQNWLGTDAYGRDVLTRVLHGARLSMLIGLSVAVLSGAVGTLIGVGAGHFPRLDPPLIRALDALLAFPP